MSRIPGEEAIEREMKETGLDRFPAIRRIQQRAAILAEQSRQRNRGLTR
ncbi:hypothetical protein FHS52_001088 [Erythromicrobium ramosum]|uniref:Uncharacterized protein n=1 Tax=Erythrobacter ramosus TaxID=35811 RepID=A0A6I4UHW0_9SPHN|nr:hypothetical protein [Erythrobacter ramosus]MBB3775145.1 hypothetical protein [Erythrobacter ramosus]MXP37227.1 hypothetical protein [Erythrobacter ramosus]